MESLFMWRTNSIGLGKVLPSSHAAALALPDTRLASSLPLISSLFLATQPSHARWLICHAKTLFFFLFPYSVFYKSLCGNKNVYKCVTMMKSLRSPEPGWLYKYYDIIYALVHGTVP